tara:strand:+ start:914 stop:1870 length:957 start_codon:yes stop_codon:yes gene_type:complete
LENKKVIILEGGFNEEHEVSLSTAKEVKKAILELNYDVNTILVNPNNFNEIIKKNKGDIYFNALHGPFGEDGKIQNILYKNKLKFTHSGEKASIKAFNKILTKKSISNLNIDILESFVFSKSELNEKIIEDFLLNLGPIVLKPVSSGSSYGVKIIQNINDLKKIFKNKSLQKEIYKNHEDLMVEKYIKGKELTVGVFEDEKESKSIDVTEIISKNIFFDYQAKYTKNMSLHNIPADIPKNIYKQCLDNAKMVHDTLGCRGITRSDFIYDELNQKVFFLEINTQPGLTPISLVPEQLKYHNINFTSLIDKLLLNSSCQK